MRATVFVGFLSLVVGFLVVTNPVGANAAMARCDVHTLPPHTFTSTDERAGIEGWLTCDSAILPETFKNGVVCLQAKTAGGSFVDIHCCRIVQFTMGSTPWNICAEDGPLFTGKHRYRTKARAFRPTTGRAETNYSPAVTITVPVDQQKT